ncbi:site-specific recombinase XerD [Methanofollis sp. W23]|uniref:site-specific integrase n=1 Tax=Methanofollis sp. W23 TaxID=2817849 RepID=UPI001AE961A9|nr:site-specific integrase [Methanofollis sp. W23]MBP2145464.1 site-specific recombinase XerD [Methanofollis sp. W23]
MRPAPTRSDSSFHCIKSEYADRSIAKGLANGTLTSCDADLIREFVAECQSCNNISAARTNKLVYTLVGWRRFIGPYLENHMADIYEGISILKTAKSARGKQFKQNTIADHVIILKQLYVWMIENGYTDLPLRKIQRIKNPPKDTMTKEATDLLTPAEVTAIMDACLWSRDRALIMMLYEGGFRIGELGTLAWKDVLMDEYGAVVNVKFKTNKPRYVRLVMAREHIAAWRADYPFNPVGEALVFLTERRGPLTHAAVQKQLDRIAKRAGITKHITPHIFRHSRITHMITEGVSESVIKLMMWGNITTPMFKTYAHLTGCDIDQEILRTYGIAQGDGNGHRRPRLEPRQCPHCQAVNGPSSNFCSLCGRTLTEEATESMDECVMIAKGSPEYDLLLKQLRSDLNRQGESDL